VIRFCLRRIALIVVCAANPLLLVPAAHAALFGDDVARKQITEQSRRVDDLRSQTDGISGRIGKIEETLRSQPVLELLNQIELLKREIQSLRGQVEVVNNGVESNAKRQRDMYVDLDTRLRRIEQGGSAPAAPAAGAAGPGVDAGAGTVPPAGTSPDEARVYEAAQQQRRNGNYQGAITSFQSFLGQYPRSPLAHRAQYWVGDSYFNLRDYKNAIASQQKLMTAYPDSASAPDAMLNIASSQAELGDGANARKTMDALVARYPSSEAAEKAKRRISTLR
jgi:tol-pal system protein YbgF